MHLARPRAYAPYRSLMRIYAPYPSLIRAFRVLHAYTPINRRLMCLCLAPNTAVSVGPGTKKFNIVRNNHGHTQICEFSVLVSKHPFWANLAQKIKIVSLSWNLVTRSIRICRIQWWWFFQLFLFLSRNNLFV